MINAEFRLCNGSESGFTISGHSGLAESGSDILCAAVSAMTMLVVNTLQGLCKDSECEVKSENNAVVFRIKADSEFEEALLRSFRGELTELSGQYPDNICVREKNISERKNK